MISALASTTPLWGGFDSRVATYPKNATNVAAAYEPPRDSFIRPPRPRTGWNAKLAKYRNAHASKRLSACAASASACASLAKPVGEIGRDAVRAARTDAGEIRFATRRRHHRREPTERDARDGEVRKFANGEIASRGGGDEEIDGEERRENRRGDAERGEPEMRGGVTSKRVVAREMRKRTMHVHVVTRERGRRGGDDGHEQRFGDEIERRAGDEREETRESRRETRRESNRRDVGIEVRRALAIRRGGGVRGDRF